MDSDPRNFWSIAEERARSETRATELRRRLETQFEPREANPADVESRYVESLFQPDVDEQVRQTLGSVAALASHDFDEGDENWYAPLLAELETCSGDTEISLYRVLMYGIFLAAGLANPGRIFKFVFGDRWSGWSLALPSDPAQRALLEVVAADPLSTRYEVDVEYILHAFIKFMMAPFNAKNARSRWDPHSRWERYDRNRATLVNLPKKPLLPGAARVPARTKLIVLYLPPTNSAPLSTISQ